MQTRIGAWFLVWAVCLLPQLARGGYVTTPLREFGLGRLTSARFASEGDIVLTTAWPDTHAWEAASGKLLRQTRLVGQGRWKAISRDGQLAAVAGLTTLTIVDVTSATLVTSSASTTATLVQQIVFDPLNTHTGGVDISGDNSLVALTWYPYDVVFSGYPAVRSAVWEVATGRELFQTDTGWEGSFSPDGTRLVYAGKGGVAYLRESRSGGLLQTLTGHVGWLTYTGFSPDGRYVLTGGEDKTARVWDAATGEVRGTFQGHSAFVGACAMSPDDRLLLTASADGTVRMWDVETSATLRTIVYPPGTLTAVDFSRDGSRFLVADATGVIVRDTATGDIVRSIDGFGAPINVVAASPDGRHAVVGTDRHLRQLALMDGGSAPPPTSSESVLSAAYSADGSRLLTGGRDGVTRLWNPDTLEQLATYAPHQGEVRSVAFVPGTSRFLTGGIDSVVALWDTDTSVPLAQYQQPEVVRQVAVVPNGSSFLVGGGSGVRFCATATGALTREYPMYGPLLALAPDGSAFVAAGLFGGYSVIRISNGSSFGTHFGRTELTALAFSPDGQEIFIGREGVGELRRVSTGALIHRYAVGVRTACFLPDNTGILVGSSDGRATLWPTGRIAEGSEYWLIR